MLRLSLFIALSFVAGCATSRGAVPTPVPVGTSESISLGGYTFHYPAWWHDVNVPALPADATDQDAVSDFVTTHFGEDTGTPSTWRGAMKVWVAWYARTDGLPVYIGHTYQVGGEFDAAARTFSELHALSGTTGELAEWYDCYLAYNAGVAHTLAGRYEEARRWYRVAARHQASVDGAVQYYAGLAAGRAALDDESLVGALEE